MNRSLRIAVVHSFYSSAIPSGETQTVHQQIELLRRAGHEVHLIAEHTDQLAAQSLNTLRTAVRVATGHGRSPSAAIEALRPDVVHVHNLFPNYGRAWLAGMRIPTVATLHNFRPLCAAGTFFRDGSTCTDCLDSASTYPSLKHACYRDSRLATFPLAVANRRFAQDPLLRTAKRLIALTETSARLYARAGIPKERLAIIPNFTPTPRPTAQHLGSKDYWLFAGRLSQEKGALQLATHWPRGQRLVIAGDGPDRERIEALMHPDIELLGQRDASAIGNLMRGAIGHVFPSRCYEGGVSLSYVEALASGTPTIAWRPSSVADAVSRERTGLTLNTFEELHKAILMARAAFGEISEKCKRVYAHQYSEEVWLARIEDTYRRVLNQPPSVA